MAALDECHVTVTFCLTPEHLGVLPHHASPQYPEQFAEFCAQMVCRSAGSSAPRLGAPARETPTPPAEVVVAAVADLLGALQ